MSDLAFEHEEEQPLAEGELVGHRYEVQRLLSTGGTSFVYLATDRHLGRAVALKVMFEALAGHSARFEREARAMSALVHPAVVRIYGLGVLEGNRPFIVMEFVPGETLGSKLDREGAIPAMDAAALLAPIAGALVEAHQAGIRHRDIKPDNIMIQPMMGGRPTVRVLDFGIAGFSGQAGPKLTRVGQIMGTPHYMAPEQATGGEVGEPADVWALGVVLQHMLTGKPPFPGKDTPAVLYHVVHDKPYALPKSTPLPLVHIIRDCLAKDPAERPKAIEILGRLEEFILGRAGDTVERPLPDLANAALELTPQKPRAPWLIAGVALGLVIGAAVTWQVLPKPPPPAAKSAPVDPLAAPASVADMLLEGELGKAAMQYIEKQGPDTPRPPDWELRYNLARLNAGFLGPSYEALEALLAEHPGLADDPRLVPAVVGTLRYKRGKDAVALLAGPLAAKAREPLELMISEGVNTRARHRAVEALEAAGVDIADQRLRAFRADLAADKAPCSARKAAVEHVVGRKDMESAEHLQRLLGEADARKCVGKEALEEALTALQP